MELTKIQKRAVDEILKHYKKEEKVKVDFKSPTGSGKTFMASWIISSLIERNIDENFVFVIATPSTSDLPFFFEQKLNVYKKDLPYSKFEVEYIESPSAAKTDKTEGTPKIILEPNKVYIFGKSTFGRGRIFTERNIINDFVDETKNLGYKLVYIRDEAHIGTLRADAGEQKFEELMQKKSDFIIRMTATPDLSDSSVKFVQIKESELNDERENEGKWLLKTKPSLLLNENIDEDELLDKALNEFKRVKEEYKQLTKDNIYINPALLIQVGNEPSKAEDKKIFLEALNKIKETINFHNLSWVQYFGDNDKDSNTFEKGNFTLDEITKANNPIDIVIFKVGPSTGWDIPRATMLLQLRKVCSDKLNIQTIGRIKRNPYPNLEKHEITDKYYIFSNTPKIDEDFVYYQYEIKDEFKFEEFPVIEIINKRDFTLTTKREGIIKDFNNFINFNKNELIQEIKSIFVKENNVHIFKKELYEVDGSIVYSSISNPFIFLKDLKRLINSRKNIYDYFIEPIKKLLDDKFKDIYIYDNVKIKLEHLQYIIFHNYTKELTNIVRKNSPFTSKYKVNMVPYEPKQYVEVYEDIKGVGTISEGDTTYLFDIKENNQLSNSQPLDSPNSEPVAFRSISEEIYALNYSDKKVKIWAKNLTSSNISGDYLSNENTFHKSFFDFLIKFENGNYLYIEVKGKEDIDPEKTKLLKKAYKDYFDKGEKNLFSTPTVISIWTVHKNNIKHESFYDNKLITENLNQLNHKDLIKTLALMK